MRVARCIKIEDIKEKKYLTLRFSNGSVNRFGECYVEESIINGSLELTNYIIGVGVVRNVNSVLNYSELYENDSNIDEASHKAFIKSRLLNVCPLNPDGVIEGKSYDDIIITDESNKITNSLRAKQITFIGKAPLDLARSQLPINIRCTKAIIMNASVMPCIVPTLRYSIGKVDLLSRNIEIKHDFIDINTVYEIYEILKHKYKNDIHDNTLYKIKIYFNENEVSYIEIKNIVINTIYRLLDDEMVSVGELIVTMHWACIMYISTDYKIDYILELVEMLNIKIGSMALTENDYYRDVKIMFNQLMGGTYKC